MPNKTPRTGLQEVTVTCRQCGSASMERLDRKEYRCTHCGAITVISDDDADRVESMLRDALNRAPQASANPFGADRTTLIRNVGLASVGILFILFLGLLLPSHSRQSSTYTTTHNSAVPLSQVVLSPLQWKPRSDNDGTYTGLLYNHSGTTIEVPRYTVTTYLKGLKGTTETSDSGVSNLQPGEYTTLKFDINAFAPHDRYEVEPPTEIDKSTEEIANIILSQAQFVHQQGTDRYSLIGVVQNTFDRPVSAEAQLILYDENKQVIGSTHGYVQETRPGEKSLLAMDVYLNGKDVPVAAYEYLIDAKFTR